MALLAEVLELFDNLDNFRPPKVGLYSLTLGAPDPAVSFIVSFGAGFLFFRSVSLLTGFYMITGSAVISRRETDVSVSLFYGFSNILENSALLPPVLLNEV